MSKFGKLEDKAKRILKQTFGGQKYDFWNICKHTMSTIEALMEDPIVDGEILNQRQCFHLSRKLSEITLNIEGLLLQCKESKLLYFKLALLSFIQFLEKAKALVETCRQKNWLARAVFQSQNENAFREILFDVGLCYNAIYEQAQSLSEDRDVQLKDLRLDSSIFLLEDDDIHQDKLDLQKKLEAFVHEPSEVTMLDHSASLETCKCLASYLLMKMQFSSQQSHGRDIDASSPLLWQKDTEPKETWGESKYLGSGANEGGVCSIKWLGIPCAKKEFHLQEYESSFLKEAGIMAFLKHPCIIDFICCGNGQAKGDRFIAMELMEKSLSDLIQNQDKPFSLPMVVDIIMQIARGMWYLHNLGVAHRDLKPQNVVLNRLTHPHLEDHFCLKLVDFGTSKTKVEASKSNTMTYHGIGTTIYRAPEAHPEAHSKANKDFRGRVNWFQADIFSFAMTCIHILTRRKPFQGICAPRELFNAVMNGARPNLPKDYPEELLALLKDCWNTIPYKRPSIISVCERLEILRHKIWRGYFLPNQRLGVNRMQLEVGLDFCKTMLDKQSSFQRRFVDGINQVVKVDDDLDDEKIDKVGILPCLCGRALEVFKESPYQSRHHCNVCNESIHGNMYHCKTCIFDAHRECVGIEDKVEVFFHHHPLYLLIQHYYKMDLNATCRLCKEFVQQSEWIYHCEQCDFDIHALCTKYPEQLISRYIHPHPLTMIHYHPKNIVLRTQCCNGEIKRQGWHYKCIRKSCVFHIHPTCSSIPKNPLCIFDQSHRLLRVSKQEIFYCGRCGSLGYSWFYQCKDCNVKLHLDCIDDMNEKWNDWHGTYEKFKIEFEMIIDDHTKMEMISNLMDMTLVHTFSKASSSSTSLSSSSSTSSALQVIMKVQPSILRPTKREKTILGAIVNEDLRIEIAANDEKRKVEKMALVKEARQEWKVNLLDIKRNMKNFAEDLQNSKTLSEVDKDILSTRLKVLKKKCCTFEDEENALHGQRKMSQYGPRIVLFFDYSLPLRFLTSLLPTSRMQFIFLCEEPGHEHIVDVASRLVLNMSDVEIRHKLQPLLRVGLEIVSRALKALPIEPSTSDYVALPILGKWKLNVNYIDLETYTLQSMKAINDKKDVEALKMAEDFAVELFSSYLDDNSVDIFKSFGLRRVRYIVSDESKVPCYTRGMISWLCNDHLNSGLKVGTLEPYPSKFYNQGHAIVREI